MNQKEWRKRLRILLGERGYSCPNLPPIILNHPNENIHTQLTPEECIEDVISQIDKDTLTPKDRWVENFKEYGLDPNEVINGLRPIDKWKDTDTTTHQLLMKCKLVDSDLNGCQPIKGLYIRYEYPLLIVFYMGKYAFASFDGDEILYQSSNFRELPVKFKGVLLQSIEDNRSKNHGKP